MTIEMLVRVKHDDGTIQRLSVDKISKRHNKPCRLLLHKQGRRVGSVDLESVSSLTIAMRTKS